MTISRIRNFAIIAHIDHGKSTLADRFLEVCGAVSAREMRSQLLDSMELERERGITIKAQTARLSWSGASGGLAQPWILNMVDTPGHVDFAYEVSRSLAACEGSLVVVDAAQGVEAQTLANAYAAAALGHEMIAALNKIDLPAAEPDRVRAELVQVVGIPSEAIFEVSAKTGAGVPQLLDAITARLPSPRGETDTPLQALVVDGWFDPYIGVVALVRVFDGVLRRGAKLRLSATRAEVEAVDIGLFAPKPVPCNSLSPGEIGFVVTGLRRLAELRVGDTITESARPCATALPGFERPLPVVFCGLFPEDAGDYPRLREALGKLSLNDASLSFEPESSAALGFGFRVGFLGLLHLEIVLARLEREFSLELVATAPSVVHRIRLNSGEEKLIHTPSDLPDPTHIAAFEEPWVRVTLFAPASSLGAVLSLCQERRGEQIDLGFAGEGRSIVTYRLPLSEMVFDFHDRLKSLSGGFASYDYRFDSWREGNLVKVTILVNGEVVEALSFISERANAEKRGRAVCRRLKEEIPRQLYAVAIQAAIGGNVIARETIRALRKDVTAKCYGGDVTRKRKLLDKQKRGKKKMRRVGQVEIPHAAFLAVLKREE